MKTYELTYIISPELKIEEAEGVASEISAFLQKEGGVVIKAENPNPKTLGYQIKKQGTGFQVSLEFNLEPEKVNALEEKIRKDSRILRFMLLVKEQTRKEKSKRRMKIIEEKPSPIKTSESKTEKKVELKDIEEKLEEILKE